MNRKWVKVSELVWMVSMPVPGLYSATAATVSRGWPPERCQRSRSLTTRSASAKARSTSPKTKVRS